MPWDLFENDGIIWTRKLRRAMKCGCTRAFPPFNDDCGEMRLLANALSHLSSLKGREFLSGFGRTRCAGNTAANLERPEFSEFQLFTRVRTFLRVKIFTYARVESSKPSGR